MTYVSPYPGINSDLFRQLMHNVSAPGVISLRKDEDPAEGGPYMMGDDDLDILTEIHEWVEREDIAEITEDLDQECHEYQEDPEETDPSFPAQ